ncbi:MAG: hypothetical protein WC451_02705 [Patescibacteria group bacterium]
MVETALEKLIKLEAYARLERDKNSREFAPYPATKYEEGAEDAYSDMQGQLEKAIQAVRQSVEKIKEE